MKYESRKSSSHFVLNHGSYHPHLSFFLKLMAEAVKKLRKSGALLIFLISCELWKKGRVKMKLLNAMDAIWFGTCWPNLQGPRLGNEFPPAFLINQSFNLRQWTPLLDFCVMQEVLISTECGQQRLAKLWLPATTTKKNSATDSLHNFCSPIDESVGIKNRV